MKTLYLLLAVAGAVVPYVFFLQHFSTAGFGLGDFLGALFVNGAAGGFTADLLISSAVFWIYLFSRGEGARALVFVVINLTIGLSCALPAYLYLRAREAGDAAPVLGGAARG